MRTRIVLLLAVVTIAGLLLGCQSAQPTATPASGAQVASAALVVKGKVAKELSLTKEAFLALGTVKFQAEHPKKGIQDYEGVLIKTLLSKAGAQADAKEILLTASDGFTATVSLADLAKCDNCALAVQDGGKPAGVFPGMASNTWVRDVISIEVK